ncbi:MAG TPA: putative transporter [Chthoniobacterales bacterium]|jgi:putative transport protein|nr:putative transporter [Chthoniobacterales bacterium]
MFQWMEVLAQGPVAKAVLALSIVAAVGLVLGSFGVRGVRLGAAGVLFAGIFLGQLGMHIDERILEFVRDFGLLLFVYTVGLHVGPGFFSSLKQKGLQLNALGAIVVLLGGLIVAGFRFLFHFSVPVIGGLFAGATTNTPSLAAAQAALQNIPGSNPASGDFLGMAYAVAYPFGIVGIILTMLLVRNVFSINVDAEARNVELSLKSSERTPDFIDLEVTNPNVDGMALRDLPVAAEAGVVFSRLLRNGTVTVPEDNSLIRLGDSLRLVGPKAKIVEFEPIIGRKSSIDIKSVPSELETDHLYVTKSDVLGKSLGELNLERTYGAIVTRVTRADVEFAANDHVRLQFGDFLFVVGSKDGVGQVGELLGNKPKALDRPHVLPVFVGILLGVILGSLPIVLPGMPAPVRLGLAGGPLIIALLVSRMGRLGPLIWYLSPGANLALREIGIVLFLACVGLKSGSRFLEVLMSGSGFYWMAAGAVLTFLPLVIVGVLGRKVFKLDYPTLCGVLAGSMTDPPALAFATSITKSDQPLVAYAAVYPMVMILRVFVVQILVLMLPM